MVKEYKQQINASPQESYISLILGFLVVVVSGILLYNFIAKRNAAEPAANTPTPTIVEESISTISATLTLTIPQTTTSPSATPSLTPKPSFTPAPTVQPTAQPSATPSVPSKPTAPPVTAAPSEQTNTMHSIQRGESLWKISEKYYGTGTQWKKIAEANNITDPRNVPVGQALKVPDTVEKGPGISAAATQLPKQYTVVAGDSLWKISIAHYGTGFEWTYIAKENKLQNPGTIYPGTVLQLPLPHATLDPPGGAGASSGETKK